MKWIVGISIFLVVVVVVVVVTMRKGASELGKAKEKPTNQAKIDFNTPAEGGKTRLEAVREVVRARVKQQGALERLKATPENDRYKELAEQYNKEATQKENFLRVNYKMLKGANLM